MDNNKNLQKLIESKPSSWKQKAEERRKKPWLKKYSSQIARRIVAIINDGDKDLNQTKLAERIGVKKQQISKIIQGHENLTLETIYKLSNALDFELISFPPYRYNSDNNVEFSGNISVTEGLTLNFNQYNFNLFWGGAGSEELMYQSQINTVTVHTDF